MVSDNQHNQVTHYYEYLPGMLQDDKLVKAFLQAFEQILSGLSPDVSQDILPNQLGLEKYIDNIHTYFTPVNTKDSAKKENLVNTKYSNATPKEFLPWLARWVALSLRDEWTEKTKREFISKIVPLYHERGTKNGLKKILELLLTSLEFPADTHQEVEIFDSDDYPPHYFQVAITLPEAPDPETYWRQARIVQAIIDQEKPAHTYYALRILMPTMRLTGNVYSIDVNNSETMSVSGALTCFSSQKNRTLLRLRIKGNLEQTELYTEKKDVVDLWCWNFSLTKENLNGFQKLYFIIDNLSDRQLQVSFQVYIKQLNQRKEFKINKENEILYPALRIYKQKKSPLEGNTFLGTMPVQNKEIQKPAS